MLSKDFLINSETVYLSLLWLWWVCDVHNHSMV